MRAIILIQAIIILLGACYVYTLSYTTKGEESVTPVVKMIPVATSTANPHPGYTSPVRQPPSDSPMVQASTTGPTGPSDAGMEYPTDITYPDQPLR